jgi:3-dehydroquinate dehydratase II
MARPILIINGPNLNLLGTREPEIYGKETLSGIEEAVRRRARDAGMQADFLQSNNEGQMIDWIHDAKENACGIIINAGAYTHTSVALMDALVSCNLPVIEVHLSNTHRREKFRHESYIAKASIGSISGFGGFSYELALDALIYYLNEHEIN